MADEPSSTPLIGLVIVAVAWLTFRVEFGAPGADELEKLPNSIAVLQCDNLSPDPDNAFFAASLHEEILNQLVKLRGLNVIARTSVMQYANAARPIPEIADELKVQSIMECSVSYADDRVAITAQLVDGETGVHLWSERYNREFRDVFGIQADIAMNVAAALRAELSIDMTNIDRSATESPEAYALYLEARNLRLTDAIAPRIHLLMDRAIALDPSFAPAYAVKAQQYAFNVVDSVTGASVPGRDRVAREYAERALTLDSTVAEAYEALAAVDLYSWRWTSARRQHEILQSLGRESATSARLHSFMGDHAAAIRTMQRVVQLNPADWLAHRDMAWVQIMARDFAGAARSLQRSLELSPAQSRTHRFVAYVEIARGNESEALQAIELSERLLGSERSRTQLPEIAKVYGQLGRRDDARRLFEEIAEPGATADIGAGARVTAYLAIGDHEKAREWLAVAAGKVAKHEPDPGFWTLMHLRTNISSHPVLEQPEFAELLARIEGD